VHEEAGAEDAPQVDAEVGADQAEVERMDGDVADVELAGADGVDLAEAGAGAPAAAVLARQRARDLGAGRGREARVEDDLRAARVEEEQRGRPPLTDSSTMGRGSVSTNARRVSGGPSIR
jgi:hypothetical protein